MKYRTHAYTGERTLLPLPAKAMLAGHFHEFSEYNTTNNIKNPCPLKLLAYS